MIHSTLNFFAGALVESRAFLNFPFWVRILINLQPGAPFGFYGCAWEFWDWSDRHWENVLPFFFLFLSAMWLKILKFLGGENSDSPLIVLNDVLLIIFMFGLPLYRWVQIFMLLEKLEVNWTVMNSTSLEFVTILCVRYSGSSRPSFCLERVRGRESGILWIVRLVVIEVKVHWKSVTYLFTGSGKKRKIFIFLSWINFWVLYKSHLFWWTWIIIWYVLQI